jgi:hypothetical protein
MAANNFGVLYKTSMNLKLYASFTFQRFFFKFNIVELEPIINFVGIKQSLENHIKQYNDKMI